MGRKEAGPRVIIIGSGLVGCETALWLAKQGREVMVVEMLDQILGGPHGMPFMNWSMLTDLMKFHHIKVMTRACVESIDGKKVTVEKDGRNMILEADTVFSAVGYKSENKLYQSLRDLNKPVYNIGDSAQVYNIMYAIWNAYEIARNI